MASGHGLADAEEKIRRASMGMLPDVPARNSDDGGSPGLGELPAELDNHQPWNRHNSDFEWDYGDQPERDMEAMMLAHGFANEDREEEKEVEKTTRFNQALDSAGGIRLQCMRLSHWLPFKIVTSFITLVYIVYLGIQANAVAEFKRGERDNLILFTYLDGGFICAFLVEILIRSIGYMPISGDKLLPLDIATVSVQALENYIITPLDIWDANSTHGQWTMILGLCRMARIASVVNLLRRFRFLEPLYLLIGGIQKSLWCFVFVVSLLSIIMVATALLFVALLRNEPDDSLPPTLQHHFSNVWWTMLTLLEVALKGLEWNTEITRPFFDDCGSPRCQAAGYIFVTWNVVIHLCILCIVTGLFIECMDTALTQNRQRKVSENIVTSKKAVALLEKSFKVHSDYKEHGHKTILSWKQIEAIVTHDFQELQKVGLNLETAQVLFKQLAGGMEDFRRVTIGDFIFGCLSMTRNTQTIDMLVIDHQQQKAVKDLRLLGKWAKEDVAEVEKSLSTFEKRCKALRDQCSSVAWTVKDRVQARQADDGDKSAPIGMYNMRSRKSRKSTLDRGFALDATSSPQAGSLSDSIPSKAFMSPMARREKKARTATQSLWVETLKQARPYLKKELSSVLERDMPRS
mmetsp:Transcript_10708/g.24402  ORF Transcript_10708/g.24402 Transcript_10708/m.24402 type:complete len:632 (+) Transcript_10708:98-1993(+)